MLFITGQFNNEDCKLKSVSAKDLLKAAGVKPWSKDFSLELQPHLKKWDPLNKITKHPKSIGLDPYYTCVIGGSEVEVRYATRTPREDKKTGIIKNFPQKVNFEGADMLMYTSNLDFCTFMFLHPWNESSPVRMEWSPKWWLFNDKEAKAKEESKKMNQKIGVILEIGKEKDTRKLRRIAMGLDMKLKNGAAVRVPGAKDMSHNELVTALSGIAMEHPEFELQYRSSNVLLVGVAREAIDTGQLKVVGLGGGVSAYKWSDGTELCRVSSHSEPFPALMNHLHDETTFLNFMKKLDAGVVQKNADHLVSLMGAEVPVEEMDAIALIDKALKDGAIQRQGMKVVILDANFEPEPNALHNITDSANWIGELQKALKPGEAKINRLRKRLIDGPSEKPAETPPKEQSKTKE